MGRADEAGEQPARCPTRRSAHAGRTTVVMMASDVHQADVARQHHRHAHAGDGAVDRGDHRLGERHEVGVWRRRRSSPAAGSPGELADRRSGPPRPPSPLGAVTARRCSASTFMSAPAQKPRPAPVSTMPTTARSRSARPARVGELGAHLRGPRVERFGPVQRDRGDRVVDLVEDLLVRHRHPL